MTDDVILTRLNGGAPAAVHPDPIHSWADGDTAPDVGAQPSQPNEAQLSRWATEQPARSASIGHQRNVAADRALWVARGATLAAVIGVLAMARGGTLSPSPPAPPAMVEASRPSMLAPASPEPKAVVTQSPPAAPREAPPPAPPVEKSTAAPEPVAPAQAKQTQTVSAVKRRAKPPAARGGQSNRPTAQGQATPARHYDESRDEDAVLPLNLGAATTTTAESRPAPASPAPKAAIPLSFRAIDVDDPFVRR